MVPDRSVTECEAALARAEVVLADLVQRRIRRDRTVHRPDFEAAARVVILARATLKTAREDARIARRSRGR